MRVNSKGKRIYTINKKTNNLKQKRKKLNCYGWYSIRDYKIKINCLINDGPKVETKLKLHILNAINSSRERKIVEQLLSNTGALLYFENKNIYEQAKLYKFMMAMQEGSYGIPYPNMPWLIASKKSYKEVSEKYKEMYNIVFT